MEFEPYVALAYVVIMLIVDFWTEDGYRQYGDLYTKTHLIKIIVTGFIVGSIPQFTHYQISHIIISTIGFFTNLITRIILEEITRNDANALYEAFE